MFFEIKRKILGVLLCSIAATQYQPLSLLVILMVVSGLYSTKLSVKNVFYYGITASIVLIPSIFYYYHFSTTNLVKKLGFLDTKFIGIDRFFSFLFDLNQGFVLSAPLLLFVYIWLYCKSIYEKVVKREFKFCFWDFIFPLSIVLICIVSSMGNWNHGQSNSNRYVVYIGTIIIVHFGWLILRLKSNKKVMIITFSTLLIQVFVVTKMGGLAPPFGTEGTHKDIAKLVLNNVPQFYNPDPHIFGLRTNGYNGSWDYELGVAYHNSKGDFKKGMINLQKISKVNLGDLTEVELKLICKNKHDQYGWVYFHREDIFSALKEKEQSL